MSAIIWHYFFQDDVDSFRQYLADATYTSGAPKTAAGISSSKVASSPGGLATSPRTLLRSRKSSGTNPNVASGGGRSEDTYSRDAIRLRADPRGLSRGAANVLTRSDVNAKDGFGRTLLHYAASSTKASAIEFVTALLGISFVDIYAQDTESGWTALHRALYFGNVSIAQALMLRDIKDATDYTVSVSHTHAGGLIKIKDYEGNSPFEVFGLTIAPRVLQDDSQYPSIGGGEEDSNSIDLNDDGNEDGQQGGRNAGPKINLKGDEVFAFGSNKNLSLGLGDEDDRQYPERLSLERPEHLILRLQEEQNVMRQQSLPSQDLWNGSSRASSYIKDVPAIIRNQPIIIQDVIMSKLHTAVLTTDSVSNLYVCGFGPGGRLGSGDEITRFNYVPIQGGGLSQRHISAIALGQDHSIAICSHGEVFTWGSNRHGQLGYALPETSAKEIPVQLLPRQLYGHVKKELIIGAAASSTHSAIFTATALYTFGKNEGQLGLMDSDARSLDIQVIPRQVGVSVLRSPIRMVSAIDRATSVLLESHEVIVFTHYGFTKTVFQLEGFPDYFISGASKQAWSWHNSEGTNAICKVASGGNTICALSTFGEVFTVDVSRKSDAVSNNVSTTNPTKARNALPAPLQLWSIKKAHMSAIDVAVGQDGSVILCTAAGSVWRKEKRAKIKSIGNRDAGSRTKDYKFVRVPALTRAIAVRSNAFGAFTAVRRDCDVTREQIVSDPQSLWKDLYSLLPFHDYSSQQDDADLAVPRPRFWTPAPQDHSSAKIKHMILASQDPESDFKSLMTRYEPLADSQYDMWITSDVTDVRIPIHSFLAKARSSVMRRALAEFQNTYFFSIPDVLSIEYGSDGQIRAQFQGADFLTIMNLVLYLYTENVVDVWHYTSRALQSATKYRQIRTELMRIATHLEMPQLEKAVRVMVEPIKSLHLDFETAILDTDFFSDADLLIELADDVEIPAHSVMLCARCPFFDGLFHGRAGGRWVSSRRNAAEVRSDAVRVDLKHVDVKIFEMVIRHMYADTGDELFDHVVTDDLDEFIDLVIEVMSVANELMLDRLAQICQKRLGNYVTTRNVCRLLNTVAECSVNEFKHVALEYLCLNLESMLEQGLLEELEEDLLLELDEVVRQNQLAFMPFARSERSLRDLLESHHNLAEDITRAQQRKVDSMRLRSRLVEDDDGPVSSGKLRIGSWDRTTSSPLVQHALSTTPEKHRSPVPSPAMLPRDTEDDNLFEMDEDSRQTRPLRLDMELQSPSLRAQGFRGAQSPPATPKEDSGWLDNRGRPVAGSVGTDVSSLAGSLRRPIVAPMQPSTRRSFTDLIIGGAESPSTAWNLSANSRTQIDLRDIMNQASQTKVSHLTEALSAASNTPVRATPKISQKERKKLQQNAQQSKSKDRISIESHDPTMASHITSSGPSSPWQTIQAVRKPNMQQIMSPVAQPESSVATPSRPAIRPPAKSSMTMRQTVAGTPPPTNDARAKQMRSASTPIISPAANHLLPQVQSIRHTPVSSGSSPFVDAHTSMADILAQQQTEKTAVKEAVAKRSLQEIQQEQEFQQWWDAETRRVQEEEERTNITPARRGKPGRSRGRGGARRGSARGGAAALVEGITVQNSQAPVAAQSPIARGGRRGRGSMGSEGARSPTA